MIALDDISTAVISIIRLGAVFRFVYCMIRLQGAEEEQAQYKKRAKNTVLFYVIAECIWQIKDIVFYYYGS
ncbi:mercury transporter [Caproicibacter fermentans]|uniref:Mercury transporter n=1 Tax=Caproicibacter fermentans TaxID=2576756 RepID=A0A7G8TF34_9FIRM|nr:mercury transporter [Caproicibacter fermentans]QNK42225.1 mercury transporter [Caproicibacter fermentans]